MCNLFVQLSPILIALPGPFYYKKFNRCPVAIVGCLDLMALSPLKSVGNYNPKKHLR